MKSAQDILDFWFSAGARKRWFKSTDAFDATIRMKFEQTAISLAADDAARVAWEEVGPLSHLALIILLDQFPRNMYRDTPGMFAWDRFALDSAKRCVEKRRDLHLAQEERPFVYMPYMHSEHLPDQEDCVRLTDARLEEEGTLKSAIIHRDIIQDFGRFPHRNVILRRDTTDAEQTFLDSGGFSG